MKKPVILVAAIAAGLSGFAQVNNTNKKPADDHFSVRLITLDPGHFHAALVQKEMYPGISPEVFVYAPEGAELPAHLDLIKQYNERRENPTHWLETVYTGKDYLEKMLAEKKGNVVVLAGNNRQKTDYINKCVEAGLNVLGDKPMAIDFKNFLLLQQAFAVAHKKNLLLYDIMTERSEITNTLQREFAQLPEVFGKLQEGTANDPSVVMESVHFFYKYVSGKVLTRPAWFFDPAQQGDAITDVGTHLIDLVQWECFPGEAIDYKKDVKVNSAKIWPQPLTISQFKLITNQRAFPDYLRKYVKGDSILEVHGNGDINYTLKNVHVKVTARWEYKAPEGSGDTHYSLLKGTKANLEIKQGKEEGYQPTLYIIPVAAKNPGFEATLRNAVKKLQATYPGVTIEKSAARWKVVIPQSYKVGHEAHFGQVMTRYLQFLREKKLPVWEVPNMLAKYYISTRALEMATK